MSDVQVVIVGAGPSGLMAANLLGQAGVRALLLERSMALSAYPRAITIDDEGLRICQAAGLYEDVAAELLPAISAHYVSRGHWLARVTPTTCTYGHPLISTLHQPTFETVLLAGLKRFPNVTVLFGHTVETCRQDEHGITLAVHTPEDAQIQIECDYVLACDGGKSTLRRALGIPLSPPTLLDLFSTRRRKHEHPRLSRRSEQKQHWLVVDCNADEDEERSSITFFCNPARPAVTVPSPGQRRRWEFMFLPGEREFDLLNDASIQSMIAQSRAIHPTTRKQSAASSTAIHIERKAVYTFRTVLAARFGRGRIFLLGDAAHLMPPFGGQGMNSGLRDAHNLCWKLAMVLLQQAGAQLLDTYEQERRPHVVRMMFFSSLLGLVIMPTNHFIAALRDGFLRTIGHIPPLQHMLADMRVKPQARYRRGFLLPDSRLNGCLLPQPYVTNAAGERVLLDDILGPRFTLLCISAQPGQALAAAQAHDWPCANLRIVCIVPAGSDPAALRETGGCSAVDSDGELQRWLRRREGYALVRPDRYVLAAGGREQLRGWSMYLQREMLGNAVSRHVQV